MVLSQQVESLVAPAYHTEIIISYKPWKIRKSPDDSVATEPETTMAVRDKKTRNTRERIIEAAKKLFAEQGYQKTTVMDIAREIELSEAALYEYFKGKEDLLLTIPDLWVTELLADMEDQLFGIESAFCQLRKYIWWTLRRIEESPLDAKVVYLFLKTNAKFMETDVYGNVRSLYAKLIDIFEHGRTTGEMDPDLDPNAAREIVIGTIDHVVTRWLLNDMSYSLFETLDSKYEMLVKAFSPPIAPYSGAVTGSRTSGKCGSDEEEEASHEPNSEQ